MANVVIIGGGFAGIAALRQLRRCRARCAVTLVDKSKVATFLPMLPDVLGRRIPAQRLTYPLERLCRSNGAALVQEEVVAVDLARRQVFTTAKQVAYDYLIIAAGTETNFYGNTEIPRIAYKLDDSFDAKVLRTLLEKNSYASYLIAGGGYTGIEIATNVRRFFGRGAVRPRVVVVERAPAILGQLPEWMRAYVLRQLAAMHIEVVTGATVEHAAQGMVTVSGQGIFRNAALIWAAGVRTPSFVQKLDVAKNPQGRLQVDEFLRINERVFVAGDCALCTHRGAPLRMAVQFASAQGAVAGQNVVRSIRGTALRAFAPADLGYVVPLANNRACGIVLGMPVRGPIAEMLHYCMCTALARGLRNRVSVLWGLHGNAHS